MCYCDSCNNRVLGLNRESKRTIPVKGVNVTVKYKGLFCERCGSELYDDNVEFEIYQAAIEKYRQSKNLLQPAEIAGALKQMTAEELAARAGCAVREIIGLSHGGIQSIETDRKLRSVLMSA